MERYYFEVRQEYNKDSWFICVYSDRDFNSFIGKWLHSDGEISSKVISEGDYSIAHYVYVINTYYPRKLIIKAQ